jgi:hypothetical protein
MPWLQYGSGPGQALLHAPQLKMSFASFTHWPPQQLKRQPQSASVVQPPPVPDELLEEEDVLVATMVLDVAPPEPDPCPTVTLPPQADTRRRAQEPIAVRIPWRTTNQNRG